MSHAEHSIPLPEDPLADRHKLGWGLAALVVAGNMIGSGLYLLPVSLASTGSSSLIGWLVAAVGACTLALVFGALGRVAPKADGLSGFAERGLGRFAGFQVSLAFWMACLVGNVAVAVAATGYLGFFWPILKDPVAATLVFAAAAVAAAAPGYLLPTAGFVALMTLAWFLFLRKSASRVDREGQGA
ncbi:amino acid permease [Brevundimonas sp. M20]|uniref:amino acid permease n=1 Tax=Brevundimonas sp. M20 TaxID=2591463 RepID=UPI00114651BC|nr:amino acid permease [Brevundimonas sp. M20]QDH72604.1 amino acid permease [Brevundimonas sp. M20]